MSDTTGGVNFGIGCSDGWYKHCCKNISCGCSYFCGGEQIFYLLLIKLYVQVAMSD